MKHRKNPSQFVSIAGMLMLLLVLAAHPIMAQFDEISLVSIRAYGGGMPDTSDSTSSAEMGFQQAGRRLKTR